MKMKKNPATVKAQEGRVLGFYGREGGDGQTGPRSLLPYCSPPLLRSSPLYRRAECRSALAYSHQQQSVLPQLLTHLTD